MSPNEINTPNDASNTGKTSKLRKRPMLLAATALALIALPVGIASAHMYGGGHGSGQGYHDRGGHMGYHMGGGRKGDGRHEGFGKRGHHGQFMGRMFDELDADGDGKVTAEEITAARTERSSACFSRPTTCSVMPKGAIWSTPGAPARWRATRSSRPPSTMKVVRPALASTCATVPLATSLP